MIGHNVPAFEDADITPMIAQINTMTDRSALSTGYQAVEIEERIEALDYVHQVDGATRIDLIDGTALVFDREMADLGWTWDARPHYLNRASVAKWLGVERTAIGRYVLPDADAYADQIELWRPGTILNWMKSRRPDRRREPIKS